jgi:hypothetical protein
MKKVRRALVVGMGAMTPAFIHPSTAQAAANPMPNEAAQGSTSTVALDQKALKSVLFALSPPEKLRIAGDRIRLSETTRQGGSPSPKPGVGRGGGAPQTMTNPAARCTIFQGPKGGPAQGPAMGPTGGGTTTIEKRR